MYLSDSTDLDWCKIRSNKHCAQNLDNPTWSSEDPYCGYNPDYLDLNGRDKTNTLKLWNVMDVALFNLGGTNNANNANWDVRWCGMCLKVSDNTSTDNPPPSVIVKLVDFPTNYDFELQIDTYSSIGLNVGDGSGFIDVKPIVCPIDQKLTRSLLGYEMNGNDHYYVDFTIWDHIVPIEYAYIKGLHSTWTYSTNDGWFTLLRNRWNEFYSNNLPELIAPFQLKIVSVFGEEVIEPFTTWPIEDQWYDGTVQFTNTGCMASADEISTSPTKYPSKYPTKSPTQSPIQSPTSATTDPTTSPSKSPTQTPSKRPSTSPSKYPTKYPSKYPTKYPSKYPTKYPSKFPSQSPTQSPIQSPTSATTDPTTSPSKSPIKSPTNSPVNPTTSPLKTPTSSPIESPTKSPSESPIKSPTSSPSKTTSSPSKTPTSSSSKTPTENPVTGNGYLCTAQTGKGTAYDSSLLSSSPYCMFDPNYVTNVNAKEYWAGMGQSLFNANSIDSTWCGMCLKVEHSTQSTIVKLVDSAGSHDMTLYVDTFESIGFYRNSGIGSVNIQPIVCPKDNILTRNYLGYDFSDSDPYFLSIIVWDHIVPVDAVYVKGLHSSWDYTPNNGWFTLVRSTWNEFESNNLPELDAPFQLKIISVFGEELTENFASWPATNALIAGTVQFTDTSCMLTVDTVSPTTATPTEATISPSKNPSQSPSQTSQSPSKNPSKSPTKSPSKPPTVPGAEPSCVNSCCYTNIASYSSAIVINVDNCVVYNVVFQFSGSIPSDIIKIELKSDNSEPNNIIIDSNTFSSGITKDCIQMNAGTNVYIRDNIFPDSLNNAYRAIHITKGSDVEISGNEFHGGIYSYGIKLNGVNSDISDITNTHITSNTFENIKYGIFIEGASNTEIVSNTFTNINSDSVKIPGASANAYYSNGLTIDGNTFTNGNSAIDIRNNDGILLIKNNIISGTSGGHTIDLSGCCGSDAGTNGAKIEYNTFSSISGGTGIRVMEQNENIEIIGNTITGVSGNNPHGIRVQGINYLIQDNILTNINGYGIYSLSYGTINRNKIITTGYSGILQKNYVQTGNGPLYITNNIVSDTNNNKYPIDIKKSNYPPSNIEIGFNSIINDNTAKSIYVTSGFDSNYVFNIYCNIIIAATSSNYIKSRSYITETYTNYKQIYSQLGNVKFVNSANNDYHLQSDSPVLGLCNNIDFNSVATVAQIDFDQISRDGSVIDAGALQKSSSSGSAVIGLTDNNTSNSHVFDTKVFIISICSLVFVLLCVILVICVIKKKKEKNNINLSKNEKPSHLSIKYHHQQQLSKLKMVDCATPDNVNKNTKRDNEQPTTPLIELNTINETEVMQNNNINDSNDDSNDDIEIEQTFTSPSPFGMAVRKIKENNEIYNNISTKDDDDNDNDNDNNGTVTPLSMLIATPLTVAFKIKEKQYVE